MALKEAELSGQLRGKFSSGNHLTRALIKAAKIINIPMLDHLILGQGAFASLRELRPDLEWDKYGLMA